MGDGQSGGSGAGSSQQTASSSASIPRSSAVEREAERSRLAREAEAREGERAAESLNAAREARREEFDSSEQGAVATQIRESERIMRLPTPDALDELGAVVGDPTKGPSA